MEGRTITGYYRRNITGELPTRILLPRGEIMEEFLKENGLLEEFNSSVLRRRYDNENQAMEMFIEKQALLDEWKDYYNSRVVATELRVSTNRVDGK